MKFFNKMFLCFFFQSSLIYASDITIEERQSLSQTSGVWRIKNELEKKDPKSTQTYVKSAQIISHNDLNDVNNTYYLPWENRTQIPVVITAKDDYLFPDSKGALFVKAGSKVTIWYLLQNSRTVSKIEASTMAVLPNEFEGMSEYQMILNLANKLINPETPFTIQMSFSQIILPALNKINLDKEWVTKQFWKD